MLVYKKKRVNLYKFAIRWQGGPKVNGTDPILVVFSDKAEKDQLWTKLSMRVVDDMVKRRTSIFITHVSFSLDLQFFFYLNSRIPARSGSL